MGVVIPQEVLENFRKLREQKGKSNVKPLYYRWTFKPSDGSVDLWHYGENDRANSELHLDRAARDQETDPVFGYAYRIKGGWRITDWEHRPVDRFIKHQVSLAIERKEALSQ